MRWKDLVLLVSFLILLNVVRIWRGETVEWLALAGLLVLGYAVYRIRLRHWRRRLDKLRDAAPDQVNVQIARLSPEERAAMRVALGQVCSDDAAAPPDGREFRYPQTPRVIREYTFWASVILAALAYVSLVLGWDIEERRYEIAIALFFTLSVGLQLVLWDRERATVRVTSFGIQSIAADGQVSGVLWSEVAAIRNRRLQMCIDFYAPDGRRRARVGYNLIGFAQFMELVVAHLKNSHGNPG